MAPLRALLDDPSFGEPCIYSGNAEPLKRRAGGGAHEVGYLCEAAGAAFSRLYDAPAFNSEETKGGGKKGRKKGDGSDSEGGEEYTGKAGKGSGSSNKNAFLKLSDRLKDVNLYELLSVSEGSSQDEIRKAYRAIALTAHPDKQIGKTEDEMKVIQEKFVQIQEAYEILSEPAKRMQYDSSLPFDDSLPRFRLSEGDDFYEVFGEAFRRNGRFSVRRPVLDIGTADSKPEEWKRFYNFWYDFQSWRDPVVMAQTEGEEICDLNDAECREERRWMQRENERVAKKYKAAERERIWDLIHLAEKYDPRIQAEKDAKKAAFLAEKAKKAEAANAVHRAREEAERKKREEEEAIKAAEAKKRQEEKAIREAEKAKIKKCRQRLRNFHPACKSFVDVDQLNSVCLNLEEADLKSLGDEVEKVLKKKGPQAAAKVFHGAMEKIGLKPITEVRDDDGASTSSGPSSNEKEDPEVTQERLRREAIAQARREEEEKEAAANRAKRDAERAEEKKKRDEQRRKEQAAQEVARRQQEKKEEQKAKKAAEKKQRDEEEAVKKKEEQKMQAQLKAQEQSEKAKKQAEIHKQEMDAERLVQLFSSDRIERMNNLDKATDAELTAMLEQFVQEVPGLAAAFQSLQSEPEGAEAMVDYGAALVFKLDPLWVLGLQLDPEIRLPNSIRNRAKTAKRRMQTIMQSFIAKVSVANAKPATMSEWQRGIVDGSIDPPVFNLELKEELEEAVKAVAPAQEAETVEAQPVQAKKKKPAKAKCADEEDLDKLLAEIESPKASGGSSPGKKAGKKKK